MIVVSLSGRRRRLVLAPSLMVLALTVAMSGCGGSDGGTAARPDISPLKGYELYSWQVDGDWYFSVQAGTNRLKTYEEVTDAAAALAGADAIIVELEGLGEGAEVIWITEEFQGFSLPPGETVDLIKERCSKAGVSLEFTSRQ